MKRRTPLSPASRGNSDPVFHGNADQNVFVTESREMVKLLRGLHADVRYTEYDRVPHQSWDRAYGEPELPIWLFAQKR